jgi:hypothetical protein
MMPAIRKPIPKNNITKKATTIIVLASPSDSSPRELNGLKIANKNGFRIPNKNAAKKNENAIKKKSCGFIASFTTLPLLN